MFDLDVGTKVFVRTLTFHYVGKICAPITNLDGWLYLNNACWVADSGRFGECLLNGFSGQAEYEVYPDTVLIRMESIVDVTRWRHDLPEISQ